MEQRNLFKIVEKFLLILSTYAVTSFNAKNATLYDNNNNERDWEKYEKCFLFVNETCHLNNSLFYFFFVSEQQKLFERTKENFEVERNKLFELIQTLEMKLNSIELVTFFSLNSTINSDEKLLLPHIFFSRNQTRNNGL